MKFYWKYEKKEKKKTILSHLYIYIYNDIVDILNAASLLCGNHGKIKLTLKAFIISHEKRGKMNCTCVPQGPRVAITICSHACM